VMAGISFFLLNIVFGYIGRCSTGRPGSPPQPQG